MAQCNVLILLSIFRKLLEVRIENRVDHRYCMIIRRAKELLRSVIISAFVEKCSIFTEKCTPIHLTLYQANNYNIKDIEYITVQYK